MGSRYLKQYDKDFMKMAILQQEQTFRQQVHELHRLYRVQKLLMNDMKVEFKKQRRNRSNRGRPFDLEILSEENHDHQEEEEEETESDLELTLATGGARSRRKKKEDSSFASDSGLTLSSSSAESGNEKPNGNTEWGLFQTEGMMKQSPWLFQCLSLKMTET